MDRVKATFPPREEWQCGELETSGCLHNDVAASGPGHQLSIDMFSTASPPTAMCLSPKTNLAGA